MLYRGGGGLMAKICRVWDADFLLVRAKCKNLWVLTEYGLNWRVSQDYRPHIAFMNGPLVTRFS